VGRKTIEQLAEKLIGKVQDKKLTMEEAAMELALAFEGTITLTGARHHLKDWPESANRGEINGLYR